jgi:hypothetical protein
MAVSPTYHKLTIIFSIILQLIDAFVRMLNFNKPTDSKETVDEPWKILIYDTVGREILSTLMKVGDLRKHGVTLHL